MTRTPIPPPPRGTVEFTPEAAALFAQGGWPSPEFFAALEAQWRRRNEEKRKAAKEGAK